MYIKGTGTSVYTTLISYQQVPLGIIMKNENKVDEMVSIMSSLHQYLPMRQLSGSVAVPGSSDLETVDVELLHKTLLGGDQLTVARARGAQSQRENSVHPKGQLSGFIPVVEDWHAKVCLMEVCVEIATCTYEILFTFITTLWQVIWARLYKKDSYRDAGTLLHLQTLINRSNVPKKPSKNVNAAEDFIQVSLITYPWLDASFLWSCCQCVIYSVR